MMLLIISHICYQGTISWNNRVRNHYILTKMAKIQNTDNTKCKYVEQEEHTVIADGNAKWHSHFGKQLNFLTNLNILFLYDWKVMLLTVYPHVLENLHPHEVLYVNIYVSFLNNSQNLEANKTLFSSWMNLKTGTYRDNGKALTLKKIKWTVNVREPMEKP